MAEQVMEAGPALDALVAEKVMGCQAGWLLNEWHPDEESWTLGADFRPTAWPDIPTSRTIEGPWQEPGVRYPGGYASYLPKYSESPEAAWRVMDKMLADPDRAIDFALAYLALLREREPHIDELNNEETWLYKIFKHLNPHTICLAARAAMEKNEEG